MRGALFLLLLAFFSFFLFFCGSRRLRKRSAPSASTFCALLSSQAKVSIRASAMFAFGSQGLHAERLASWLRRDAVNSFFLLLLCDRRLDRSTKGFFLSQSKPFPKPQRAVIATLGPACRDVETLKDMLEAGMSCARVDLTVRKGERKERDTKTRKKERGERIDARRCRLLFRSPLERAESASPPPNLQPLIFPPFSPLLSPPFSSSAPPPKNNNDNSTAPSPTTSSPSPTSTPPAPPRESPAPSSSTRSGASCSSSASRRSTPTAGPSSASPSR